MTDVRIVNAEALTVAPDEVLIIKLGEVDANDQETIARELNEILIHVGLRNRSFILIGDDIELAKVNRGDQP